MVGVDFVQLMLVVACEVDGSLHMFVMLSGCLGFLLLVFCLCC